MSSFSTFSFIEVIRGLKFGWVSFTVHENPSTSEKPGTFDEVQKGKSHKSVISTL